MAVQNPFFGKRDNDAFQARQPSPVPGGSNVTGQTSTSTTNPSRAMAKRISRKAKGEA